MTNKLTHKVLIQRNATGEQRWYEAGEIHEGVEYMWADGNYSCDCNRALFWARAGGELDLEVPCSESAFTVLKIEREDGYLYPVDR